MKYPVLIKYYLLILIVSSYTSHPQVHPGWEVLSSGIGFGLENLYFLDSQMGFCTIDHDGVRSSLIRTTNGGLSWNSSYFEFGYVTSVHFPVSSIGYMSFNDQNGNKIFNSTDLGETWVELPPALGFWIISIFFTDSVTGYAAGGLSGGTGAGRIAKTTDGGLTWSVTSINSSIRSIHFPSPDTGYAIGNDQSSPRIYKTTDSGLTWNVQNAPSGVGTLLQVSFANNNIGYIVSRRSSPFLGYIIKTENGGLTWNIQYSLPDIIFRSVFAVDEAIAYVVGDYGTILKTTNGGILWDSQQSQTFEILRSVFFVDSLSGYAVGGSYVGTPMHVILKTTTGGEPIIPVELISFAAIVEKNDVNLFWTTATELNNRGFEIQRLQDYNITRLSEWIPSGQDWSVIGFVEGDGTTTETNHYSFKDNNLSSGMYQYRLKQIDFDGTFEYSNVIEIEINIPNEFSLSQNYPNPFNPSTTLEYQIPSDGFVSLKIYNSLGQEVSALVNETQSAGKYSITFSADELPSGLYFYSIKSEEYTATKKMILLR